MLTIKKAMADVLMQGIQKGIYMDYDSSSGQFHSTWRRYVADGIKHNKFTADMMKDFMLEIDWSGNSATVTLENAKDSDFIQMHNIRIITMGRADHLVFFSEPLGIGPDGKEIRNHLEFRTYGAPAKKSELSWSVGFTH